MATIIRKKQKVKVEPYLMKALRKSQREANSLKEAAEEWDLPKSTFERILGLGTCSPDTLEKLKAKAA